MIASTSVSVAAVLVIKLRKCLFVATVATDSAVFVATLPVKKIVKQEVYLRIQHYP